MDPNKVLENTTSTSLVEAIRIASEVLTTEELDNALHIIASLVANVCGATFVEIFLKDPDEIVVYPSRIERGRKFNSREKLDLPLEYKGKRFGTISLTFQAGLAESYNFDDFLLPLTSILGVAIEINRANTAERIYREQALILQEIAQILNQSLNQTELLETMMNQLNRVIPYDSASIMFILEGELKIVAHRKLRIKKQFELGGPLSIFSHIQHIVQTRLPLIIPDTLEDSRWIQFEHGNYVRCWLGVPLVGRNHVFGVLNLDKEQPGYYSEKDASLAVSLTNQAAIAIENARLYSAERRRVEQLDALRATIFEISSELDLKKLLKAILIRSASLLGATGGDLGLYNQQKKEISIIVSHNAGKDYVGTKMELGEGAMGLAIQNQSPVLIDDYPTWPNASSQYQKGPWHAVLAVPILAGDRIFGAIGIFDSNPKRCFTEADGNLLNLFAQHAAIAIRNANLFTVTRLAADRSRILHRASQIVVAVHQSVDEIYTAIHDAVKQIMHTEIFLITRYDQAFTTLEPVFVIRPDEQTQSPLDEVQMKIARKVVKSKMSFLSADLLIGTEQNWKKTLSLPSQRSVVAVPMMLAGNPIGTISTSTSQLEAYYPEDVTLLEMLASYAAIAIENASLLSQAQQQANIDPVTGIPNRRQLFETGGREFQRAQRFSRLLSVVMLDIDNFKEVNDRFGHAIGDYALGRLAQWFKSNIRDIDTVGRYGGEEFVIILPETSLLKARDVADRLRKNISQAFDPKDACAPLITISAGIAELGKTSRDFNELVQSADYAMYLAKRAGKNRTEVDPYSMSMASPNE